MHCSVQCDQCKSLFLIVLATLQIGGMRSYGMTDEVKEKVQTLLQYKWAKAIWEAKEQNVQKAYSGWLHDRSFPLPA